jgi:aryl-alcohol dehydrogenase-like predicted oxidoreductase
MQTQMQHRALGRSGLKVSPVCFGGNVFGWTASERTSFELLDAWLDAGFNFVDTADVYSRWVRGHSGGESETIIGRWLAQGGGRRERIVIATKVGMDMGSGQAGLGAAHIRRAVEGSLRRLQVETIDLYQAHKDDPETPLEETLEAFARLIQEGKVRAIGASNYTAARLREALDTSRRLGLPRYEALQPLYNLYDRADYESELEPLCVAEDIGVINYYTLAAGFLSGKYGVGADANQSARAATVSKYLTPRGLRIVAALDAQAARLRSTPARVAVAWTMRQPGIVAPIASATSLLQLQDLVQAAQLFVDPEAMQALDAASAPD